MSDAERITKSNAIVKRTVRDGILCVEVWGRDGVAVVNVISGATRLMATNADGVCELLELLVEAKLERGKWYRDITSTESVSDGKA